MLLNDKTIGSVICCHSLSLSALSTIYLHNIHFFTLKSRRQDTYADTSVRAVQVCERAGTVCRRSRDLIYNAGGSGVGGWGSTVAIETFVADCRCCFVSPIHSREGGRDMHARQHARRSEILHLVHFDRNTQTRHKGAPGETPNSSVLDLLICGPCTYQGKLYHCTQNKLFGNWVTTRGISRTAQFS